MEKSQEGEEGDEIDGYASKKVDKVRSDDTSTKKAQARTSKCSGTRTTLPVQTDTRRGSQGNKRSHESTQSKSKIVDAVVIEKDHKSRRRSLSTQTTVRYSETVSQSEEYTPPPKMERSPYLFKTDTSDSAISASTASNVTIENTFALTAKNPVIQSVSWNTTKRCWDYTIRWDEATVSASLLPKQMITRWWKEHDPMKGQCEVEEDAHSELTEEDR